MRKLTGVIGIAIMIGGCRDLTAPTPCDKDIAAIKQQYPHATEQRVNAERIDLDWPPLNHMVFEWTGGKCTSYIYFRDSVVYTH